MECFNADLKADMERWQNNKRQDFRQLLMGLADKNIQYYEKVKVGPPETQKQGPCSSHVLPFFSPSDSADLCLLAQLCRPAELGSRSPTTHLGSPRTHWWKPQLRLPARWSQTPTASESVRPSVHGCCQAVGALGLLHCALWFHLLGSSLSLCHGPLWSSGEADMPLIECCLFFKTDFKILLLNT